MFRIKPRWSPLQAIPCLYLTETLVKVSNLSYSICSFSIHLTDNLVAAHNHVREMAGLFDVSHMLQHKFTGPTAQSFLMSLTPSSLDTLPTFSSTLSVLLNEEGGIIDDTIITKQSSDQDFYVVTNAGRIKEDTAHIEKKLKEWNESNKGQNEVKWEKMEGWGLLALQGPKSSEVLEGICPNADLEHLSFGKTKFADIDGAKCHIARAGYTGEDGFEVSLSSIKVKMRIIFMVDTADRSRFHLSRQSRLRILSPNNPEFNLSD